MTARTSSRSAASVAAARISSCTAALSAFIFGRSSRMVPIPPSTSNRTNSPTSPPRLTPSTSRVTLPPPPAHHDQSQTFERGLPVLLGLERPDRVALVLGAAVRLADDGDVRPGEVHSSDERAALIAHLGLAYRGGDAVEPHHHRGS